MAEVMVVKMGWICQGSSFTIVPNFELDNQGLIPGRGKEFFF
jgi:hypothetical protein